jgi:ribonuclease HI
VTIATDGACKRNPGPTGWAWVSEDGRWESGSLRDGTNNIGELLALLNALDHHADVPELTVLIDSQYVINAYDKWMDGWNRKSWVTASGTPVANPDIMRQLIQVRDARRARGLPAATLVKVKGHSGHVLNAWADIKAVAASERGAAGIESEQGTGYGDPAADTSALPAGATVRAPRPRGGRRR